METEIEPLVGFPARAIRYGNATCSSQKCGLFGVNPGWMRFIRTPFVGVLRRVGLTK